LSQLSQTQLVEVNRKIGECISRMVLRDRTESERETNLTDV